MNPWKHPESVSISRHPSSEWGYHLFHNRGHEGGKKRPDVYPEFLPRVPSTPAENSAEDVSTTNVVGNTAIAQRKGEGSDMVCDHAVRGVDTIGILLTKFTLVRPDTSQFLDPAEDWGEDVGIVI